MFGKHRSSQRSVHAGVSIETPDMLPFCRWLEHTSVGAGIRESLWLFPAIETVHLLGMAALVGTIAVFDLRLSADRDDVVVLCRHSGLLSAPSLLRG